MLSDNIISGIEELVKDIKEENGIINAIIRDDVFSILQACNCTVLYYPLEGEGGDETEGCDGCHLEKPINGKMEQLVFINTINTRERQAFSAAHELGHIWKVDDRLKKKYPKETFDSEEAINRFAAELLMPKDLFKKEIKEYLKKINYQEDKIKFYDMINMIAYQMNYFFVPFKAVVLRFIELGSLNERYKEELLRYKNSEILKEIIKSEQYTRLGIVNKIKSMDNLQEFLQTAEAKGLINDNKIANIRKDFDIQEVEDISLINEVDFWGK